MTDVVRLVTESDDAELRVREFWRALPKAMLAAVRFGAVLVQRRIMTRKLQGEVLKRQTGTLIRSWQEAPRVQEFSDQRVAVVIGSNLEYARGWEFGFTIPAHVIRPKKAKALRFLVAGVPVFAKSVSQSERRVAARPYARPALDEERPEILAVIAEHEIATAARYGVNVERK